MCQRGLGWHAACNDVDGSWGLDDPAFTRPTSIFGSTGNDHPELGWNDIQALTDIFANDMTLSSAGAGALWFNDHLHALKMLGQ